MTIAVTPFPQPPGTVDAQGNVTVRALLNNPLRVQRIVRNMANERFVADLVFGPGPNATGGAVLYDQVSANDLYLARDVQTIEPGGQYPTLTDEAPVPKMAAVAKWGGRVFVTDEARDRNRWDTAARQLTKLVNTIVRKVDAVAILALRAAPTRVMVGADWSVLANDPLAQLIDAIALVNGAGLGYEVDTVVLHDNQAADLLKRKDFRDNLGPSAQEAIVRNANLGRILNLDFVKTDRLNPGEAFLLQRRIVGSIHDEAPLATKTYRQEDSDKTWVQGSRRLVPTVTDPLAVVHLTGI